MTYKDGQVASCPARIFRISFTGDLSYEISVPADHGAQLWAALLEAGQEFNITPYGTQAMHVLRAEKGFIIVGQETDGSVVPADLGMNWIVSKKKDDFVGKRSLTRTDMLKSDRKQLVGLVCENPQEVLEEGAQLVLDPHQAKPMRMLGHVTSAYYSPSCGQGIAMAMVKGGRAMQGETLWASSTDGRMTKCKITDTIFFDREGLRQKS